MKTKVVTFTILLLFYIWRLTISFRLLVAHALTTSRSVVSFSLLTRPPGDLFSTPRVGSRHPLHRDMGGGGASRDLIRQGVSKLGVCVMQSNHAVLHRRSQVSQLIHLVAQRLNHTAVLYAAGVAVVKHRVELEEKTTGF